MAKGGATVEISLEKYEEMQDRIAQLEKENEELREAVSCPPQWMHWISVKDRLPKSDLRVIVYDKYLGIAEGYCISADDTWWLYYPVKRIFPSYWMPLPEPPEVEDNEAD